MHPLDDLQPVTRGQQFEVSIGSVDDDPRAIGRLARLMYGEIGGKVSAPVVVRAKQPKRGECDHGDDNHDKADGLYGRKVTTKHYVDPGNVVKL